MARLEVSAHSNKLHKIVKNIDGSDSLRAYACNLDANVAFGMFIGEDTINIYKICSNGDMTEIYSDKYE